MPFVLSYKQGIAMFISILALMSAGASVQCAQNGDPVASNTPEAATVLLLPVLNDIGKNGKEEKWALGRLHDELSKWFRDQGMEVIEIKPETDKPTDGSIDPSSPLSREQCGMLDLGKKNGADYVASCRLLYYQ
ncbi:MAG: hypothetical protein NTU88_13980, partial [Armatimonadetes bacterium]|nr:hypothetical protein [Armatimonadota bacterium]